MANDDTARPTLGLLLGDRNGIGPEIAARVLADPQTHEIARAVVIGGPGVLAAGQKIAGVALDALVVEDADEIAGMPYGHTMLLPRRPNDAATEIGQATADAGAETLALLAEGANLADEGTIDGFVFAPLNKEAMHLGGLVHEDEMQYMKETMAFDGDVGELNELEGMWTTRVTSHVPLKNVAGLINEAGILRAARLAHDTVRESGIAEPRLAICALNPHGGDGGNFGREEIEVIAPAAAKARAQGMNASDPLPCDTVFVRAQAGEFDAVVTMYHDQGQIAMKLMGFSRGVTVLGGLPMPVVTCGHGTGYDIAGKGVAATGSIANAWKICARMARAR
jgi:4-hydroxythreonine-4-phosphate dehydrogenase